MRTSQLGWREKKKQATRKALREAALRLALENGPNNVRVDDIAEAAGVSPRTYNNYFSSREEAIVAAISADREARVASSVATRLSSVPLADAVVAAIVEEYTEMSSHSSEVLLLLTSRPTLREAFIITATGIEDPLADVIAQHIGESDKHVARVLSASVAAAVRVALERWLQPLGLSPTGSRLLVPSGSLADLLRTSLRPIVPALIAVEEASK